MYVMLPPSDLEESQSRAEDLEKKIDQVEVERRAIMEAQQNAEKLRLEAEEARRMALEEREQKVRSKIEVKTIFGMVELNCFPILTIAIVR